MIARCVTWLPVRTPEGAERDAVFGLSPEPYAAMRRVLEAAWRSTDARVLELCRCRLAQLTDARAELASADPALLERLDVWEADEGFGFTAVERAALAFAEQYHYDHRLVGGPMRQVERFLSRRELVNFVWALHMNDAYIRGVSLLDIAPDPSAARPRPERTAAFAEHGARPPGPDEGSTATLLEPRFYAAYRELNPTVVRQSLVDDVTSEAVRLRNASHQGCVY